MTTQFVKKEKVDSWFLVDAKDRVLGRLASEMATILAGKHKAGYSPHQDNGDFLVVLNANKVRLTGKKEKQKKGRKKK